MTLSGGVALGFVSLLENQRVEGEGVSEAPAEERLALGLKLLQPLGPLDLRQQAGRRLQVDVERR